MDDNVIRDFFFKLGFDGEDVLKGLKSVQKEFSTLQKSLNKISATQTNTSKNNQSNLRKEINLEKKKLAIKNAASGIKSNTSTASSNPETQRQKEQLAIQKRIAQEAKKQHDYQMRLRKSHAGLTKRRVSFSDDVDIASTRLEGKKDAFAGKAGGEQYKRLTADLHKLRMAAKTASEDGLVQLKRRFKQLNVESSEFIKKNKAVANSLLSSKFAANSMKDSMRNLARSYASVFAIVGGAGMAINQGMKIESSKISLITGTGSLALAAEEYKFVNEQAKKYGLNLAESVKAYGRIQAGAKMANMSVAETREMFDGLNTAAVGFSLTSDEMTGIFKAITDSLSKGTLMAEELKGQLGDRMPVAVGAMAQALKVTTPELMKMMERGELIATEVLPKLSKGLKAMAVDSGGFAAGMKTSNKEMARFGTTFQMNMAKMFNAGAEKGLAGFFRNLTGIMEQMSPVFRVVGKVLGVVVELLSGIALAAYQVIRPVGIIFESLIAGADDGTNSLGILMRAFYLLAAAILTPFVWLEKFNNALADSGTIAKTSLGVILIYISKVLGKFFFMNSFLGRALSGVGLLSKAFGVLKYVAIAALSAIKRHPVIASIFAVVNSLDYLMSKATQASTLQGKETGVANYSQLYGTSKDNDLVGMLSTISAMKHEIGKDFWGMFGVNLRDMAPLSSVSGGVTTYHINVTTPDTEAAVRTITPYLENRLTTWSTDMVKSSMAPGEN